MKRTNAHNDGRDFQTEILTAAEEYRFRGFMRLRKADPPMRLAGGRVIMLENPWLDFGGAWTERGGRALFIEAKSTSTPVLPFDRDGGITEKQMDEISNWRLAGAVAFVLWRCPLGCALLTGRDLIDLRALAAAGSATRTLRWERVRDRSRIVQPGDRPEKVPWDFRKTMLELL